VTVALVLAAAALAAASPKGAYAPLDRLPDWGGVWILDPQRGGPREPDPVLKGQYLKDYEDWRAKTQAGQNPTLFGGSLCLPTGMPRMMTLPQYPIEFLFTPGRVTMHFEAWMQWRNVWTDGRGHPADWDPTFSGHSTGHWEGETLVVDTAGVNDRTALVAGMKHSPAMHVVERIHLAAGDPDHLLVEMTVDDPVALERPWATVQRFKRVRDGELYEYVCAENDRNPVDAKGDIQFK
jgi:hypothetical protein